MVFGSIFSVIIIALTPIAAIFANNLAVLIPSTVLIALLTLINLVLSILPYYSTKKWLIWLYKDHIIGKYKCIMESKVFFDNRINEIKKNVEWNIEIQGNDLIHVQTTDQAKSIAKLLSSYQDIDGMNVWIFEYSTQAKMISDPNVPLHNGIIKITSYKGEIISAHYMNPKPSMGNYTNIKKME